MTLKERLEEGLRKKGYRKLRHPRSNVECWQTSGSLVYIFVGVNGGLRMGKSKSDSWSIKDSGFYKEVLAEQAKGFEGKGTVTDLSTLV